MVAVVVVVAATVSVFVLGIGEDIGESAPTAEFDSTPTEEGVAIVHTHGETLETSELKVRAGDLTFAVDEFTDQDDLSAGDQFIIPPQNLEPFEIVWDTGEESTVINTVTPDLAVFQYTGESQSFDIPNDVETIEVELLGPGGGVPDWWSGAGFDFSPDAGTGGYINATIDVSERDSVTVYVGGTAASDGDIETGGWGFRDGGDGWGSGAGGTDPSGGGGATAIEVDSEFVLIAGGGGGGANLGPCDIHPGGGGGSGGSGGEPYRSIGHSAEDGERDGVAVEVGGDGAGSTATTGESCPEISESDFQESYQAPTDGLGEVIEGEIIVESESERGGGAAANENGIVRIGVVD